VDTSEPKLIYTAGIWDWMHEGHLNILRRSKALGTHLIVGVVSDDGAEAYKRRPVQHELTRLQVVAAVKYVDAVVLQPTTDPTPILEWLRPAVMTHGDDWDRLLEGNETLKAMGIEFVLIPYTHGVSSTETLQRMAERHMDDVQ